MKKLLSIVLAAIMVMALGVTAFAAETAVTVGDYSVDATLYKEEACTNTSMGNSGIDYIEAYYDGEGNVEIVLVAKPLIYNSEDGQLDSFALYAGTTKYTATKVDELTFVISDFPADQFQVGSVLVGEFTSYVSIMGTRTGYLKINSLTEM